ncbi:DUF1573 domain-containing protein [Flavobacterium sp.]|uniref:DUF1573 domain-containing protein n=1 Tax=Flavobacterium sp. TaxID=239 RepID=UPI002613A133|nr:DUF1573 domain-containing protein [Flavobacterium sp.]
MKKILLVAALSIIGVTHAQTPNANAKPATPPPAQPAQKVDGPQITFENETIDYGTIPHNADGNREFVFVNTGNKPLIIESAQGSCGCTVPTTPKDPIQPGQRGVIGVRYATDRVGQFTKNVTVRSNALGNEVKVLTIKGNVLQAPQPEGTAPVKS